MRLALAAALLFASISLARADDKADIRTLYDKLQRAMTHKDVAAIRSLETPDFYSMEGGKKVSGKQLESEMKRQFAEQGKIHFMSVVIGSTNINGNTAKVSTAYRFEFESRQGAAAKPHVLAMLGTALNTVVKTPHGWKFASMETTSSRMLMDGRPVNTPPMGAARGAAH